MQIKSLIDVWRLLRFRDLRLQFCRCPGCGFSVYVRLCSDERGVRCLKCRATVTALSVIKVLNVLVPDIGIRHVYELSVHSYLQKYFRKHAGELTCSEYLTGVAPGTCQNGVRCEDVQRLSFAAGTFDVCTSTETFEHVPNDILGFREVYRVLKMSGVFIFTVPLYGIPKTRERAKSSDDGIEYFMPPQYHDDILTGPESVLVFREYGRDITVRLCSAGFASAEIVPPAPGAWWGFQRAVVVARKAAN
ncbi:MAG: methyltransferase domain-containing protein [Gammaproteobacteria bacterium]